MCVLSVAYSDLSSLVQVGYDVRFGALDVKPDPASAGSGFGITICPWPMQSHASFAHHLSVTRDAYSGGFRKDCPSIKGSGYHPKASTCPSIMRPTVP